MRRLLRLDGFRGEDGFDVGLGLGLSLGVGLRLPVEGVEGGDGYVGRFGGEEVAGCIFSMISLG